MYIIITNLYISTVKFTMYWFDTTVHKYTYLNIHNFTCTSNDNKTNQKWKMGIMMYKLDLLTVPNI